ncbi:MAG TPA: transglutaminase family protein [Polyangiaceae bacterium]|nr:transglutaminase family protein [Polyangiaceae bacterium]
MTRRMVVASLCALVFAGEPEPPRLPFTEALLAVEDDADARLPSADAGVVPKLAEIAGRVRAAKRRTASRAEALNSVVFGELGFVREVNDSDLRFVSLSSVLQSRRGSCVGLGTLYIALGELLGWPVEGVMVPGHFYVRVVDDGDERRNVELLRRGEEMPDAWYAARFAVPGRGAPEYARALSPKEVLAVVEYDVGRERIWQGRLSEARRVLRRATALFPAFAEAHASLGEAAQLLGALDEARGSYLAARRENPDLPGVQANLELVGLEDRSNRSE